ncbi:Uncharacterised protein [uncultured archaeon]|nr:Uncharacterised protein [uncultured archaeon]
MNNKGEKFLRNKRGQFFLIAAVVIIVVIVSIATVSNYTQKTNVIKLYDLGQQLGVESQQVLDYGTYSELNDSDMTALMENFIQNYVTYIKESKNVYFVFGNKNKINVIGYQDIKNESVCVQVSPAPTCGNGIVEDSEQCDDGNTISGDDCSSLCKLENSTAIQPTCGNGIAEATEQCDDGTSNGITGDSCSSTCTLLNPTNGCDSATKFCESTNLNEKTCASLGFETGTLSCNSQCGFNTSSCTMASYCGDNQIQTGEMCDGTNLNEKTCASLGFASGNLACKKDCNFDSSDCLMEEKECSSYLSVGTAQEFSTGTGKEINKVVVRIESTDYEFTLKQGENFYFVIWENVGGEKQVVTS